MSRARKCLIIICEITAQADSETMWFAVGRCSTVRKITHAASRQLRKTTHEENDGFIESWRNLWEDSLFSEKSFSSANHLSLGIVRNDVRDYWVYNWRVCVFTGATETPLSTLFDNKPPSVWKPRARQGCTPVASPRKNVWIFLNSSLLGISLVISLSQISFIAISRSLRKRIDCCGPSTKNQALQTDGRSSDCWREVSCGALTDPRVVRAPKIDWEKFTMMRLSIEDDAPPRSTAGKSGLRNFVESWYYDPFRWALLKSWGFFFGGVYLAQEIATIDLNNPVPVPM